jgi:NAD(P)H dehydrogenase (quinone)
MEKTLILGATGKIASLTADLLYQASPECLRVATSREAGLDGLRSRYQGVDVVRADWNERSSLIGAMKGVRRLLVVTPGFVTDESLVTPNIIAAVKAVGSIELLLRLVAMPPGCVVNDLTPEYLATRVGAAQHVIARPLLEASGLPVCYVNVPAWFMLNLPWFLATEVKAKRQINLPAATDASRMWVSEFDIAAVMAKILTEPVSRHVGHEYMLTSADRSTYADIARMFSEHLGAPVVYNDDDKTMHALFGQYFDTLMTYMISEGSMYASVPHRETVAQLLGRPQQTLSDYIAAHLQDYK